MKARTKKVVVIGSGHNALICACYLARAGLEVQVLERDFVIGGAVSTVERWPGYAVDRGSSLHVMLRFTGIVEDLELENCGLEYLTVDPWAFAPFWRGKPGESEQVAITFESDLDATCESIEGVAGSKDASAYHEFVIDWQKRNERIFDIFQTEPTPRSMGAALFKNRTRNPWGNLMRFGRNDGLAKSREFLLPADALLDETFDNEELKTALAWLGAQSGPPTHEVATADLMAWFALLHGTPPWRAVGGSGSLTQALAERLRRLGGQLLTGHEVIRIEHHTDRVSRVITKDAEEFEADIVVAGCHIIHTANMLGDHPIKQQINEQVRVGNGLGMAVRLATSSLPEYPATAGDSRAHTGMQLLVQSREHLKNSYAEFLTGRQPNEPSVLAMTFSAIDPTIAPPGKHNVTLWAQWYPHQLNSSSWPLESNLAADRIIAQMERMAPGFSDTIEHMHVQTPDLIESELALVKANVMHVEMTLDSTFWWRPLPAISRYRMPIKGLYLTGASTHPGGGVFGASGRSSANAVLSDLGRKTH